MTDCKSTPLELFSSAVKDATLLLTDDPTSQKRCGLAYGRWLGKWMEMEFKERDTWLICDVRTAHIFSGSDGS